MPSFLFALVNQRRLKLSLFLSQPGVALSPFLPFTALAPPLHLQHSSMSYWPYWSNLLCITQLVITGDLNLHLENPLLHETVEFAVVLDQFGLKQHVSESTHKCGGWLDVMVTKDDCQVVDIHVQPPVLSDHGLIVATIPLIHQPALYITRQIRHWKSLDRDAFADALRDHPLFSNIEATPALTVTQLFNSYSTVTSELLDAFLPIRTVKSRHCPLTPWFDTECRLCRHQARCLEKVFRRMQLASDKTTWIQFVRNMHDFYRRR